MPYDVTFGAKVVLDRDFDCLNRAQQREMVTKLETSPETQKALTGSLRGYFRLRIADFRVVYRVDGQTVTIVAIGPRRDDAVYNLAGKRT